jgi:hypothetical protein
VVLGQISLGKSMGSSQALKICIDGTVLRKMHYFQCNLQNTKQSPIFFLSLPMFLVRINNSASSAYKQDTVLFFRWNTKQ